ncbi:hypothetical protein Pan44_06990 [Caulifigura coniformis]|uniref:Carboxypeptidase regulatory-like domain-containing protein n=1 Tax=Caulifigura coniformis TaxID=2527983 RepID=A0A517S976_9PLAN|nr:hypothetical protein [Caulifigura coniformis]QDT52687.1 hypothetical protein Pan44_06990 [Caulifigura coniformis]
MMRPTVTAVLLILLTALAGGCGGETGPQLAETVGVVMYKGKPLASANVTFIPASGPAAYTSTDEAGAFALSTSGDPGAMVGPGTFVVTAFEQLAVKKSEEQLTAADIKKMNTSLIPAKYGRPETSGLNETIKPDVKNEFKFDLQ